MTGLLIHRAAAAVGLAATFAALSLSPAAALPLSGAAVPAAPASIEQVRCDGCWIAGGIAAGALAGAAIVNSQRPYYGGGYYYEAPPVAYAPPVVYAAPPAYYAPPRYYPNRCWVQTGPYRGQGYWGRC